MARTTTVQRPEDELAELVGEAMARQGIVSQSELSRQLDGEPSQPTISRLLDGQPPRDWYKLLPIIEHLHCDTDRAERLWRAWRDAADSARWLHPLNYLRKHCLTPPMDVRTAALA